MKTTRLFSLLFALALVGCSAREATTPAPTVVTSAPAPASAPVPVASDAGPANPIHPEPSLAAASVNGAADLSASDTWNAIKDSSYDQRAAFNAGFEHITSRLDSAIQVLNAKRSTLPETSVQDWDFAMKELADARTNLRFQLTELAKATPETWGDAKDRAAEAWQRVRDDFDKVKSSTTI